jgi:DNA-binding PadR family transcriptional regulator
MNRKRRFKGSDRSAVSLPWIHILLTLADGDRHGYAVMREVEDRTGGEVTLWPATLYGAIRRMTEAGLVDAVSEDSDSPGKRRRYYRITDLGRQVLAEETGRLAHIVELARAKNVLPSSGSA